MAAADLVIGFGLDPLEQARLGWACRSPILSLTRCPTSVLASGCESLSYAIASEVVGDIGVILEDLAPRLLGRAVADWDIAWLDRLRRQRLGVPDSSSSGLTSRRVVQIIREVLPDGAIATVDAGPHALSALASWQATDLGQLVIATGLETVGMALPAAIAARLCHADRPVVCFTDAAGLALTVMELETAARLDLSILVVVFGNGEPVSPAPGVQTFVADSERGLARVLPAALGGRGPAVIDARVDAASRI